LGLLALYVGAAPGLTPNLSFRCLQELFLSDHRNLHQVEARFVEFGIAIQPLQTSFALCSNAHGAIPARELAVYAFPRAFTDSKKVET
jgi:hypothetical protein